jgi:hypothetical protein
LFTSKYGFSVVAPIKITVPSSTYGSSASCCNLLKRCISSINKIHFPLGFKNAFFASSIAFFISAIPAVTAFILVNLYLVVSLITLARDVLPAPWWSP